MADSTSPPIRSRDIGVLRAGWGYASIGDKISDIVLTRPVRWPWMLAFLGTLGGTVVFLGATAYLFARGIGIWGVRIPVAWGFAIANFVWWIGIGHAGTFISAILLLLRQRWRTSINRFAEAMTLFAVAMAGLFPILHLGRPWFFYWIVPYPDHMNVWPQWRSPLVWDLFAISTYVIVSLLFWYMGLVPDLATLRDRAAARWKQVTFGLMALGWRGEARDWARHQSAYLLLAGLATPLVVSVHSVVSWDFAVSLLPGWHSTLFPPYFVAGAILSGVAMILTILVPLRRALGVEDLIGVRHLELLARLVVVTGAIVAWCYVTEMAAALSSPAADPDRALILDRMTGRYAPLFWLMIACNCGGPALLLAGRIRRSPLALLVVGVAVNVGMWIERFTILVTSLGHDRLPFTWRAYRPTWVEWTITAGALGWFLFLFLVGLKLLPPLSVSELKEDAAHGAGADVGAGLEAGHG